MRRNVGGVPAAALALGLCAAPAAATAPVSPEWEALRGVPVADIRIRTGEVFDTAQPSEDHFLFRWANALHVRTRAHVIRREILFDVGDPFVPELAAESERNLRALFIFQDATLTAESTPAGVVVEVVTSDRWSTELRTELRSQGGISQIGFGLYDVNMLGRAFELGGQFTSSTDIDGGSARWRDPRVFGSRWMGGAAVRSDELERTYQIALEHPFYTDRARWSAALSWADTRGVRRRFEDGEEIERLDVLERLGDGWAAVHPPGSTLSRWAVLASRRQERGEVDENIAMAGLAWSSLQRHFRMVRNVDFMGSIEDISTGFTLQLAAGADLRALGADQDRSFVRTDLSWSRELGASALLGCQLRQYAFLDDGARVENGRTSVEAFGFWQTPGVQTLAWRLGAAALVHEPPHLRFNLGGDDRLRGYEARHLTGERILYAGIEERLFTDRRLFFLRLGGVLFADAAAAWDGGEPLSHHQARLGGGLGLRLGTNRAGSAVAGLDLAFGTNSVQLSFSNGSYFRVARRLEFLDPRPFR